MHKGAASIDSNNLIRGMRLAAPIGLAVGISSFGYTHSISRGVITGLAVAVVGSVLQGLIEEKAKRRRQSRGIALSNAPVRPKLTMEFMATPRVVMDLCREGLRDVGIRIRRIEFDEPLRIVVVTKASFNSFGERITAQARVNRENVCSLEISSVPRLFTAMVDLGVNYTNVFLLAKFVKDRLGGDLCLTERLIDLDRAQMP